MRGTLAKVQVTIIIAAMLVPGQRLRADDTRPRVEKQQRARVYEESCLARLRVLNVAQGTYWGGDPDKGFARTLRELGPRGAGIVESGVASGKKDGYRFHLNPERTPKAKPVRHYTITARPIKILVKGQ